MKRGSISICILLGLVCISICSLLWLKNACRNYAALTEVTAQALTNGDQEIALQDYQMLLKEWDFFQKRTGLIADGSKLNSIREILGGLQPLISEDTAAAVSELERLRFLIEALYEEEKPEFWNIL